MLCLFKLDTSDTRLYEDLRLRHPETPIKLLAHTESLFGVGLRRGTSLVFTQDGI